MNNCPIENIKKRHKARSIDDMPRKYKLTEQEKSEIPQKFTAYIKIQESAINMVKERINLLEKEGTVINMVNERINLLEKEGTDINKIILKNLKHGLNVLEVGLQRDIKRGVEGLIADLERYKKDKRPGFGLSRGFGEFLDNVREDWAYKIMDAVSEIEDYFRYRL